MISLARVLKVCNFTKKTLKHKCFLVNIPKILGTVFYRTTSIAGFELSFSVRNEFFKKES